jgi:hypothetical protein
MLGIWQSQLVTPISVVCGVLLLVAAALKLYGLNVAPFAQAGPLRTPAVQSAAVIWEALLGAWLLSGACRSLSWTAAVATFVVFAGISGYLGLIGQAYCGCFGVVQASPWVTFALDLAVLSLLVIGRPPWPGWQSCLVGLKQVVAVGAVLVVVGGITIAPFGSVDAAMAKLRGESLGVNPAFLDFGSGAPGDRIVAKVTVRNWTDKPVRVYGGTSDCTCLATLDLPVSIEPRGQVDLAVRFAVPRATAGLFSRKVELLTDCRDQPTLRFHAGCRVKE